MKFLLFDSLLFVIGSIVYAVSIFITYSFVSNLWSISLFLNSILLFLALIVFIFSFIVTLGICKKIVQPRLVAHDFPIGMNKDYIAWGLNSIFCGLYLTAPFAKLASLFFGYNWLYYRFMGMKLPFNTLVGMNTTIRQPELVTIGEKSIIGLGAIMSCHFTADGKIHTQRKISIGTKSVVGGYSQVSPGCIIGDNSILGAHSLMFPDSQLGSQVKTGAKCFIDHGVVIPNNVKLKSHTRIRKSDSVKSGEIWAGDPAQKIGELI